MKLQHLVISLICIASSAFGAGSSVVTTTSPWEYSASTLVMSKYYGTIVGGIFYDGPMSFTDLVATRKDASGSTRFDLSIGQKLDRLSSYNKDGGNEYDVILGRTQKFGSSETPIFVVDASVTYLALTDMKAAKDDVFSSAIRIDAPQVEMVQPYVVVTRFDFVGDVGDPGTFVYAGLMRNQPVGASTLTIDYRIGYSLNGLFGADRGLAYHRLSLSLPIDLGDGWTVIPSVIGQIKGNGQRPGHAFVDRARLFATLAIAKSF